MSFILDALKKSETDRQRQASPETAFVPTASGARRPGRWVWVVGALLTANVIALIVVLMRPDAPPRSVETAMPEPATPGISMPEPSTTATRPAPEPAAPATRQQAVSAPAERPPGPAAQAAPTPVSSEQPDDTPADQGSLPATAAPAADFMTLSEARMDGLQVDDLSLELHVFSSTAAERFVFINMRKYREGDTLDEGPNIREIRSDGVLLEFRDTLFLLPRE